MAVTSLPPHAGRLQLDQVALERAKKSLEDGANVANDGPWREDVVKLLDDSLATELV